MIAIKNVKSLPYSGRPVAGTFKTNRIGSARHCTPGKSLEKDNPSITVDGSSPTSSLVGENLSALKQEHEFFTSRRTGVAEAYRAASPSTLHSTLNIEPPDQHQRSMRSKRQVKSFRGQV